MANLKDLIVTGSARVVGKIYGTVTKAIADSSGNNIESTYVKKSDYLGFNLFDTKTVDHILTGAELVGFALAAIILYFTQYFVAGYSISWMAAIIGALIYGVVDYFIPGNQQM